METRTTVSHFSRSMRMSQTKKRRKVDEKNPIHPIERAKRNMTPAAWDGRTQVCLSHNGTRWESAPSLVRKYTKETRARTTDNQKGKNPGPGWLKSPKPRS